MLAEIYVFKFPKKTIFLLTVSTLNMYLRFFFDQSYSKQCEFFNDYQFTLVSLFPHTNNVTFVV